MKIEESLICFVENIGNFDRSRYTLRNIVLTSLIQVLPATFAMLSTQWEDASNR